MAAFINHDGDRWEVLAFGGMRGDKVYAHLASTTRFREQRNGRNPIQIADYVSANGIEYGAASDAAADLAINELKNSGEIRRREDARALALQQQWEN